MVITLASLNKTADSINQKQLAEIESEEYTYEGTVTGKFEEKRFPVDLTLKLKVGAQVMFTRNDQHLARPSCCYHGHGNRRSASSGTLLQTSAGCGKSPQTPERRV